MNGRKLFLWNDLSNHIFKLYLYVLLDLKELLIISFGQVRYLLLFQLKIPKPGVD